MKIALLLPSKNRLNKFLTFLTSVVATAKDIKNIKLQFENNLLSLREEKRKEHLECWKDLMFLKKYLMTALREYWDLVKRREVLEGG